MSSPLPSSTVALVTGSNRGIGRALIDALIARGVGKVYAAARSVDSVRDLVAAYGSRVVPLRLDVTDPVQVRAATAVAPDVTLLINNAGFAANADLLGGDLEAARQEFEVNYWGPLQLLRAFAPSLKGRPGATVVTVSSVAGLTNFPMYPTYSDSKAAVHSLVTGARHLLRAHGVKVLGVYPGPVDTDMAKSIPMAKATPKTVADAILDAVVRGDEDVFPDPMAVGFAPLFQAGAKVLERQTAAMLAAPA
jgi:NAD(P)-dependent dehydrogenase (short-subunit alcohol dehydrogenase family)